MKRQGIRKSLLIVSFLFFPATINYFSPVLIIDGTAQGIITGSFIVFLLLFIFSLFFGRAFCGWLCPGSIIQDYISEINNKQIHGLDIIKWLIWVPWISIIFFTSFNSGGFHTIDPFYQTTYGLSVDSIFKLLIYFFVIILIVVPAFLVGKRCFCRIICWMAPFMIIGRKLANYFNFKSLRINVVKSKCKNCKSCEKKCPMNLPIHDMINKGIFEHSNCILCGRCVDLCENRVLEFKIKKN